MSPVVYKLLFKDPESFAAVKYNAEMHKNQMDHCHFIVARLNLPRLLLWESQEVR